MTFNNSISNITTNTNINLQKITRVTNILSYTQQGWDNFNSDYLNYTTGLAIYVI